MTTRHHGGIGDRIRELRRARARRQGERLTQSGLAERVGVSRGTVAAWEGDVQRPAGENLVRLAQALGTSPSYILTGAGGEEEDARGDVFIHPATPRPGSGLHDLQTALALAGRIRTTLHCSLATSDPDAREEALRALGVVLERHAGADLPLAGAAAEGTLLQILIPPARAADVGELPPRGQSTGGSWEEWQENLAPDLHILEPPARSFFHSMLQQFRTERLPLEHAREIAGEMLAALRGADDIVRARGAEPVHGLEQCRILQAAAERARARLRGAREPRPHRTEAR